MSSLAIALLCAAAPPLPTAKPMGGARLFPIDPVAIIDEGARKEGEMRNLDVGSQLTLRRRRLPRIQRSMRLR